ncbi:MAG TPA: AI-2E family transporter [Candidatus Woesearchaeota archaeon]|nr:AI-2E family transporter [Candidatus Woesearchaeota archaeon]
MIQVNLCLHRHFPFSSTSSILPPSSSILINVSDLASKNLCLLKNRPEHSRKLKYRQALQLNMELKVKKQTKTIFNVVILIVIAVVVLAMSKFLAAIFSGLILAYVFYPVFDKISKKIKSDKIAASITLVLTSIAVILPVILLISIITVQGLNFYSIIQKTDILETLKNYISNPEVVSYIQEFIGNSNTQNTILSLVQSSVSVLTKGIHTTIWYMSNLILGIFIGLAVMFFALIDRGKFIKFLESFLPFSKKNLKKLENESKNVIKAVLYGEIPIALIQGSIGGIGFAIFGLGGAALWAIVMAILSFFPFVGTSLVWVPASIYLYFAKGPMFGIGMFLYGLFIVSYVDNILRMKIMSSFGKIHPLTTLFGILIGVMQFGIIGLVIGPLFLALLLRVLHIMKEEKF